jgi:hypothetical protein
MGGRRGDAEIVGSDDPRPEVDAGALRLLPREVLLAAARQNQNSFR